MAVIRALMFLVSMTSLLLLRGVECYGDQLLNYYDYSYQPYEERISALETINSVLARQLLHQQQSFEEKNRATGDSGLVRTRIQFDGPKTYFAGNTAISNIHNHPEFTRTMGMGEIQAVLNGVDFRTRHNDYSLVMPSTTSSAYHATQDVPFPEIPPQVSSKESVDEQIAEMREWFKAWRDSDYSVRDYRPYFKPVLCYLEGAWTTEPQSEITEPYYSTRHHLDASSWEELHQKSRFESSTGIKYDHENMAHLPTKLFNDTDGKLALAQWNYRILCHPIETNLEKKHLKVIDDLGFRLSRRKTLSGFDSTRGARFQLNADDEDIFFEPGNLLDAIMCEVPGKDNYQANITDDTQGFTMYSMKNPEVLNVGYYHRYYKEGNVDVTFGEKVVRRGFGDRNLFVAETTQENVVPVSVTLCESEKGSNEEVCRIVRKRVSYATPWEILWLNPLHAWNPYHLVYKGDPDSELGQTVTANKRKGGLTANKAYDGTNSARFFQTPAHFFGGGDTNTDVSNEVDGVVGVLDGAGNVRQVIASGLRVFSPSIDGVGYLRMRYPVMPLHDEGSLAWKEVEALRDVVMDLDGSRKYINKIPLAMNSTFEELITAEHKVMLLKSAESEEAGFHHHVVYISPHKLLQLKDKQEVTIRSLPEHEDNHSHDLVLKIVKGDFKILTCDGRFRCEHDHGKFLVDSQNPEIM